MKITGTSHEDLFTYLQLAIILKTDCALSVV